MVDRRPQSAPSSSPSPAAPQRRVVLLGASNLTRGLASVLSAACRHWGRPLDVLAALGNGRSYGATSCILGRSLPGILQCGLWDALDDRPELPTAALVTDIGNDVLYGYPVDKILGWIERCLDRLQQRGARVAMTALPIHNLDGLSTARFYFFRTLYVPSNRMSRAMVIERVIDLNERLQKLAAEREITLVLQRQEWYGLDPMHLRLASWTQAWGDILSAWGNPCTDASGRAAISPALWLRLQCLPPERRRVLGLERRHAQPCARLPDGTTISLY